MTLLNELYTGVMFFSCLQAHSAPTTRLPVSHKLHLRTAHRPPTDLAHTLWPTRAYLHHVLHRIIPLYEPPAINVPDTDTPASVPSFAHVPQLDVRLESLFAVPNRVLEPGRGHEVEDEGGAEHAEDDAEEEAGEDYEAVLEELAER